MHAHPFPRTTQHLTGYGLAASTRCHCRVTSGSSSSFETRPNRSHNRAYRLLPAKVADTNYQGGSKPQWYKQHRRPGALASARRCKRGCTPRCVTDVSHACTRCAFHGVMKCCCVRGKAWVVQRRQTGWKLGLYRQCAEDCSRVVCDGCGF